MHRLAFLLLLALFQVPHVVSGVLPLSRVRDARFGDIDRLCKAFCSDDGYSDYSDYSDYGFRDFADLAKPRIFCWICQKKITTTPGPTSTGPTTATPSTSAPTTPASSTTALPTSSTPRPTTAAPTTSTSSTTTPSP